MDEVDYADSLHNCILSGDFSAFQKILSKIEKDPALLQAVLEYNAFGLGIDRYTLVQTATVYAIETGFTEMLMLLLNLGASDSWEIGLPTPSPVLFRQNAFVSAEYFAYSDEINRQEENEEHMEEAPGPYVVEHDSVDASFERALVAGRPYAARIMKEFSERRENQLTDIATDIIKEGKLLNFMSKIVYEYVGEGSFMALRRETTQPAILQHRKQQN